MERITKSDTVLWINHAVSYFKSINKTQKDMARILDLDESRISEMKNGVGTLSPSLMRLITEHCGAPRRNPGRYLEAELYKSIDSFVADFSAVTNNRAEIALLKLLKNERFYSQLLSKLSLTDIYKTEDKQALEHKLNTLLASAEFTDVCDQYMQEFDSNNHNKSWYDFCKQKIAGLEVDGLLIADLSAFKMLYLISKKLTPLPGFKLGEHKQFSIQPVSPDEPMVMTGNRVLVMNSQSLDKFNKTIKTDELARQQACLQLMWPNLFELKPEEFVFDKWACGRCDVYLSENLNYHFIIHLSATVIADGTHSEDLEPSADDYYGFRSPGDRLVVIEKVNVLNLFQQIEFIRKWFSLPEDTLLELREKIAKAGGYIPGAKVLL